jgi:hypothetical protein
MKTTLASILAMAALTAAATEFTGPTEWQTVQTNAVNAWCEARQKQASAHCRVFRGVCADTDKKEIRILAEAVGHRPGITTEFLLVGPMSDRAYESLAITVASPGDIARAVEALGIKRGGGIGSRPFRFWPCGERLIPTVRRLSAGPAAKEEPVSAFIADSDTKSPLVGPGGIVFTAGRWSGADCLTDTNMPASVFSLYNEPATVFDVPFQVGQSQVYGRLSVAAKLTYGELLEVVLRPWMPKDGKPRVLSVTVRPYKAADGFRAAITDGTGRTLTDGPMPDALAWLKTQADAGREPFVTVDMDEALTVADAKQLAQAFAMLDGKGIKLDGRPDKGVYPLAFLPQEKWRERKDRVPQPFELHLSQDASGALQKRLTFIEEDWSVEGLDPKLTPRDYPFKEWPELLPLVEKAGGADNKVHTLFVYAPAGMALKSFLPGINAVASRLQLVYVFSE